MAWINVSGTPHSPKPADNSVEPDLRSATAASAEEKSLDSPRTILGAIDSERRDGVVVNARFDEHAVGCFLRVVAVNDAYTLNRGGRDKRTAQVIRGDSRPAMLIDEGALKMMMQGLNAGHSVF
jgi:hypothetical protein